MIKQKEGEWVDLVQQINKGNKRGIDKKTIFEILAIALIILFAVTISPKYLQNDTFYTVSLGELILQNGIDMQDHFSWHELPYTYPHWLYDVGTALVYRLGGWTGIYIMTCTLAAILGICIYRVNSKLTKNSLVSFFITLRKYIFIKGIYYGKSSTCNFYIIYFDFI